MQSTEIKSAQDIFSRAKGGATEIAFKLGVHICTVERFAKTGVNDKYWEPLRRLYGIPAFALYKFNAKIRGYRA